MAELEHSKDKEDLVVVVHDSIPVNEDDNNADLNLSLSERSPSESIQGRTHIGDFSSSISTLKHERNQSQASVNGNSNINSVCHSISNVSRRTRGSTTSMSNTLKTRLTTKSDSLPSTGSGGIRPSSLWAKLSRESAAWETMSDLDDNDDDDVHRNSCATSLESCCVNCATGTGRWLRSTLATALSTPTIGLPCLLLFASLVACGMLVIHSYESVEINARKGTATKVAEQTDLFFERVLEQAFVPLFTMAQFVKELPEFHDLDAVVGDRCDPEGAGGPDELGLQHSNPFDSKGPTANIGGYSNCTSAPVLANKDTHRNMTDLYATEYGQQIEKNFNRIAAGIKANSRLGKSLINIQLAPKGVLTYLYPMINCEDFEGIGQPCLDNKGAWGLDLMHHGPSRSSASMAVVAKEAVTVGPLNLVQGTNAFIGRFPIYFDDDHKGNADINNNNDTDHSKHSMVVDGVDYPCWGFVSVLLNWERLKEESNIYNDFEAERMQFKLTRMDAMANGQEKIVTIAESANSHLISNDNITLALHTNGWVIAVGYDDGFNPNYKAWAYPIIVSGAFAFSVLMMLVLVSKTQHERILLNLMPARAIRKLRKGQTVVERYTMVTIFFSDIVGYTNMSSEMTPIEVMTMLNGLYSKLDVLAKKHGVFKVETIGDAYIAVAGAPDKCSGPRAAEKMTLFALDALRTVRDFHTEDGARIAIRAGLASGPVVAGVVGSSLPKYTLFGDTVNFAARMEQTSEKMRLQVSPVTHRMLLDAPNYQFEREERRGEDGELGVMIKGKGRQYTYWVTGASELQKDSLCSPTPNAARARSLRVTNINQSMTTLTGSKHVRKDRDEQV